VPLITCRGSKCGLIQWARAPVWVSNNAMACDSGSLLGNQFLRYLFAANSFEDVVTGSAQPQITMSHLSKKVFDVCPSEHWPHIVGVLGAIDDRITLLRETNATLEAIAQALFKSWFVDFDPVRAKMAGRAPEGMDEATAALFPDALEETELGVVPKGWQVMPLSDALQFNPSRPLKKGVLAPYLDMASVATSGHRTAATIQRELGSGTKFRNGDTLLARITPCLENGKAAFVDFLADGQIGWGSTEFLVMRPKRSLPDYFAYLLCKHQPFLDFAIQSMVGTSGRQRIQNEALGRYPIVVPSDPVAQAFDRLASGVQASIAANDGQAQTLATLRDTLLPRLISGQLRLPEAQTQLEPHLS
jgi:type I restriction enzyme S subunit